jgi:hypothetical protein
MKRTWFSLLRLLFIVGSAAQGQFRHRHGVTHQGVVSTDKTLLPSIFFLFLPVKGGWDSICSNI